MDYIIVYVGAAITSYIDKLADDGGIKQKEIEKRKKIRN